MGVIDALMTAVTNLISVQQRLVVAHRKMFDFVKFDGHSLAKASLQDKCPPLRPLVLKKKKETKVTRGRAHARVSMCLCVPSLCLCSQTCR